MGRRVVCLCYLWGVCVCGYSPIMSVVVGWGAWGLILRGARAPVSFLKVCGVEVCIFIHRRGIHLKRSRGIDR